MTIVYILADLFGFVLQNAAKKSYNKITENQGAYVFSSLTTFAAILFFTVSSGGVLNFSSSLIPWSLGFGIFYGLGTVSSILAIGCGSLALTALMISYSLVIPTLFGIIFLNDPVSPWLFTGIGLLLLSLFLINYKPGEQKITLRWVICVGITFFSNAFCTIIQKMQQLHFNGRFKSEFMILALLIVFAALVLMTLIKEREILPFCLKKGGVYGLICGAGNGLVNLMVMILTAHIATAVLFPLLSAGGILATSAVSLLLYKERLSRNQIIGIILGIGAIVFLNM